MAVGLVKYGGSDSLRQAVELCDGFRGLRSDSRVLIKPNLVTGRKGLQRAPGVVTSDRIVDDLVVLLQEFGCQDIAIGEGSIALPEAGLDTPLAFVSSGMAEVARKRGVALVDFNGGPHETVDLDGARVRVSSQALRADFFINLPVLKTHNQTRISLGLKNLKGCLDMHSKKKFHHKLDLERSIATLASKLPAHLTIVDGIYGLEKGPFGNLAHRMDVVVAGTDALAVDAVGSLLLGIDPQSVAHLREYAYLNGLSLDAGSIDVRGEAIASLARNLEWRKDWTNEILEAYSIEGMTIDVPGNSNCSGCSIVVSTALTRFLRERPGTKFDRVEVCVGKEPRAKPGSKQVFLLGKCPMGTNRDRRDAIRVKGCPPTVSDICDSLESHARKT
ncbi:MAG: DUF362 domain-containing protein [Chloroflexi bacterium]|nr:DUF362 domain-containing protein [Chloroflexota bacterium]